MNLRIEPKRIASALVADIKGVLENWDALAIRANSLNKSKRVIELAFGQNYDGVEVA